MDLFEEWLGKKGTSSWVKRALTDPSYNNYRSREVGKEDPEYCEKHKPLPVNTDLATYGDALIKFAYSELMLDEEKELSVARSKVESDEYFVKVVARHYDLLKYIDRDSKDRLMPHDYDYEKRKGDNPRKYIATAVEAMIGAIYKETNDLEAIIQLLDSWRKMQSKTICCNLDEEKVRLAPMEAKGSKAPLKTQDVCNYILSLKAEARRNGRTDIQVVALDLAHHFGRMDRTPIICQAMMKAMGLGDTIIYAPPKGKGTRLKINYLVK